MPFDPELSLTIFTDASYDSNTNVFGWAFWIKYGANGNLIRRSGSGITTGSTQSEYEALVKAIDCVVKKNLAFNRFVTIQCDCMPAMANLDTAILMEVGARAVNLKHVKGHQRVVCSRSAVNTWCDRTARHNMRKRRDKTLSHVS